MCELVCVVAIVGIVSATIVAIVFGSDFRGKAGPGGVETMVGGKAGDQVVPSAHRGQKNGRRKKS
jgi:hypothetical protein